MDRFAVNPCPGQGTSGEIAGDKDHIGEPEFVILARQFFRAVEVGGQGGGPLGLQIGLLFHQTARGPPIPCG